MKTDEQSGWATRYRAAMNHAREIYADVVTALLQAEIPAEVIQTGGMCLAITFPIPDGGYFLLTDQEDVLSWEPKESDGWGLGAYDDDGTGIDDFFLTDDVKSPATAVALAVRGINEFGRRA